jgi:hypothetical protein
MTIDIGNNNFKELNIFSNDDPYQIAFKFCFENKLGADMLDILK